MLSRPIASLATAPTPTPAPATPTATPTAPTQAQPAELKEAVPLAVASGPAPALWLLVLAQLNPGQLDFSVPQLAELLHIDASTLRKAAAAIGLRATRERTRRGRLQHLQQYRLSWNQACGLVNYAAFRSRSLDAEQEYARLLREKRISPDQDWKALALDANDAVKSFRKARAAELGAAVQAQSSR